VFYINCIRKDKNFQLASYTLFHALVDFTCAFTLFGSVLHFTSAGIAAIIIFTYNFCAFALQPFIGLLADRFFKPNHMAAFGCAVVGIGTVFAPLPVAAAIIMGIGNSCFHIGGGVSVLRSVIKNKASSAGIFVSAGAVGLAFGIVLGKVLFSPIVCICIMAAGIIVFLVVQFNPAIEQENAQAYSTGNAMLMITAVMLLLISIFIRSFVGFTAPMTWKTSVAFAIAAAVFVTFGKALGGVLADKLGFIAVAAGGLAVSALLLPFLGAYMLPSLFGLLFFNMTMPVTLVSIATAFPKNTGFAFGLAAMSLLPGSLFCGVAVPPWLLFASIIVSAVILSSAVYLIYKPKISIQSLRPVYLKQK
jgi:hypothetical protein